MARHFGCPVRIKSRRNVRVFSSEDMDRAFGTHNEDLLTVIGAQLELELSAVNVVYDLADQVKRAVKRTMTGKRPDLLGVAQELGMSERTLQCRLTEGGSSFQKLAEDARRELAHHYLGNNSTEYHEVAYVLGDEDANSFFRAIQHWEGTSPGAWRAQHVRSAIASVYAINVIV